MVEIADGKLAPEIRDACNGCGVCVELCPVDIIKIVPRKSYKEVYNVQIHFNGSRCSSFGWVWQQ